MYKYMLELQNRFACVDQTFTPSHIHLFVTASAHWTQNYINLNFKKTTVVVIRYFVLIIKVTIWV